MAINPSGLLTWGPSGPGGLSSLHGLSLKNRGPNDAGTLAQVAIEAETHFLTYLLENLRKSLVGSLKSSPSGMQGYQSLVDQNLARSMAMGGASVWPTGFILTWELKTSRLQRRLPMESNNPSTPQKTLIQEEMCLYQELLDCLEEESRALMTAQEEDILSAAARKEALLERLLKVKRMYENSPQAMAAGQAGERLAHLRRQVVAANARSRDIIVTSLEVVQEFLAQFQPPGPGLYEPAGVKLGQTNALFQRQV